MNMLDEKLGRVVWQERDDKFIFIAKKDRRMFEFMEILSILDEFKKLRKEQANEAGL